MRKVKQFKIGDKVFAKVKGYPPWPAIVVNDSGKKFSVQFYGTGEMGFIKPEELFHYLKHKTKFMKGSKKKEFHDALNEIELAIKSDGDCGNSVDYKETEEPETSNTIEEKNLKRKRSISENTDDLSQQSAKKTNSEQGSDAGTDLSSLDKQTEELSNDCKYKVTMENETEPNENKIDNEEKTVETEEENEQNIMEEEPEQFSEEIKIVSENILQQNIIYAEHVKSNPDLYKARPVEPRDYCRNQVFPVFSPSAKTYLGLKLHKNWPLNFQNEYESAQYDEEISTNLLALKEQIMNGGSLIEDESLFMTNFNMTESEVKADFEMQSINRKFRKVERLRNESKFVELDANIKNCLSLDKADTKKAISYLDDMFNINVDCLMLKKHSHVVDMIRRLRKYVGNVEEWDLDEKQLEIFKEDAEKIRKKAETIYEKFKEIVNLPNETVSFWNGFNELVSQFQNNCKAFTRREIFVLCSEPDSRQAFIDKIEMSSDINIETEVTTDTEKENCEEAPKE